MPESQADPRRFSFYLTSLRELGAALAADSSKPGGAPRLKEGLYRVLGTLAIGRGALLLWDEEERRALPAATKGMRLTRAQGPALSERAIEELRAARRPFHAHLTPHKLQAAAETLGVFARQHKIQTIAPLGAGASFVGLLLLGAPVAGQPLAGHELEVLEEMASLLALRIDESRMRRQLACQVRELQRLNTQMRQIYLDTVRALAGVIDGPEESAFEEAGADEAARPSHSLRVAALGAEMARRLGLSHERRESLYFAGLLHDIGKQIIDREILGKSGPLDARERRAIEAHPAAACDLISHLRFPWGDVAEIIRHHHERLDGKGYPDRLRGDQISLEARILMLAEAFDSMTSEQPWRPALPFARIVQQIQDNLGLQFDPLTVKALCEAVEGGLDGDASESDFVPHLEASFDPATIRSLLGELRRQIKQPAARSAPAMIVAIESM